ncbi:hypothetical protein FB468_1400 [Leucobacter komagatae]|uniref:Uncharacterized protein n=1 Tax=Leucobacter komagatae TaxID=55969 RepID=A0A542Y5N4_9MICO|nr:hypothetical protein [Leucobacter komagatae]TQL43379.1 hypothetical protein FB468_1400 [Leucobacter komagatae]
MKKFGFVAVAFCALLATVIALGSFTTSFAYNKWQRQVSQLDQVVSAEWSHVNNWPTGGSRYTGEVRIALSTSEAQARELVEASCGEESIFDEVIYEARSPVPNVSVEKRGLTGVCGDKEELADFARILNVLDQQSASFEADVLVWSYEARTDYATGEETTEPPSIRAETTTAADLFAFAAQAHRAVGVNNPFDFAGSVDDDVSPITSYGKKININVPADYDLAPVFPVLSHAFLLEHKGISYAPDTGIVVAIDDAEALAGEDVAQARQLAEDAAVPFSARLADTPFGSSEVSETRQLLLSELARLPAVEATTFGEHETIVATTTSLAGITEVLDYFGENNGERLNAVKTVSTAGKGRVTILLKTAENDALTIRLDAGVASLADLRAVVAAAAEILTATTDIREVHIQSFPDKLRVHVTFESYAASTTVEATEQELRGLLPLTTIDTVAMGWSDGRSEYLNANSQGS